MTQRINAVNPQKHWPEPGGCECGDRFRNPDRLIEHLSKWLPRWHNGPSWRLYGRGSISDVWTARIADGHALLYYTGLTLLPQMGKVQCTCGWSRYVSDVGRRHSDRKAFSRKHMRDVVEQVARFYIKR